MTHEQMAYLLEIEPWRLKEDAEIEIMGQYRWLYSDEKDIGWYCCAVEGRMEHLLMARARLRLIESLVEPLVLEKFD